MFLLALTICLLCISILQPLAFDVRLGSWGRHVAFVALLSNSVFFNWGKEAFVRKLDSTEACRHFLNPSNDNKIVRQTSIECWEAPRGQFKVCRKFVGRYAESFAPASKRCDNWQEISGDFQNKEYCYGTRAISINRKVNRVATDWDFAECEWLRRRLSFILTSVWGRTLKVVENLDTLQSTLWMPAEQRTEECGWRCRSLLIADLYSLRRFSALIRSSHLYQDKHLCVAFPSTMSTHASCLI